MEEELAYWFDQFKDLFIDNEDYGYHEQPLADASNDIDNDDFFEYKKTFPSKEKEKEITRQQSSFRSLDVPLVSVPTKRTFNNIPKSCTIKLNWRYSRSKQHRLYPIKTLLTPTRSQTLNVPIIDQEPREKNNSHTGISFKSTTKDIPDFTFLCDCREILLGELDQIRSFEHQSLFYKTITPPLLIRPTFSNDSKVFFLKATIPKVHFSNYSSLMHTTRDGGGKGIQVSDLPLVQQCPNLGLSFVPTTPMKTKFKLALNTDNLIHPEYTKVPTKFPIEEEYLKDTLDQRKEDPNQQTSPDQLDYQDKPSIIVTTSRPNQVLVNRKLLEELTLIRFLEEELKVPIIIERAFCESIGILIISPTQCLALIRGFTTELEKDLRYLATRFEKVKLIVDLQLIFKVQQLRRTLNKILMNHSHIQLTPSNDNNNPTTIVSSFINETLPPLLLPSSSSNCLINLDSELTAHERLLVNLKGLNHWKAQLLLSDQSFNCCNALLGSKNI